MIKEKLSNSGLVRGCSALIAEALEIIKNPPAELISVGNMQKSGMRFIIQNYETAPAALKKMEAHRKFIDIQLILEGREKFYFADSTSLKVSEPYDEDKDIEFYSYGEDSNSQCAVLEPGEFAIFFPEDAHKPGCSVEDSFPSKIKKLLVKIPVK